MTVKEQIFREIGKVPAPYLAELLDFIYFLEHRAFRKETELAIARESSLKKDWLKSEEEESWKNL